MSTATTQLLVNGNSPSHPDKKPGVRDKQFLPQTSRDTSIPGSVHIQRRHTRLEDDADGLAWLYLDHQGPEAANSETSSQPNVLDEALINELHHCLTALEARSPKALIITSAKPEGFIAGADVKQFQGLTDHKIALDLIHQGQQLMERIAALPYPVVALIQGYCLGGGTELALACSHRLAVDVPATRIGLPEVKLGIHPGFGGTLRLPRIIGSLAALDLMLTGRNLDARRAKKLGLVDAVTPERQARDAAKRIALTKPQPRRANFVQRLASWAPIRPFIARKIRATLRKKVDPKHYPAPWALLDLWEQHYEPPAHMLKQEAESVARLIGTSSAQNLVRTYLLHQRLQHAVPKGQVFAHVHVIGAGVMGGDIAAWCAYKGLRVSLQDTSTDALGRAVKRAASMLKRKLHEPRREQQALDRLIPDPHGHGMAKADVIIEAIFEDLSAKRSLFHDVEAKARPDAVLASNTSSIPLEQIAQSLKDPGRLVGLHFFNPVPQMELVEIVRPKQAKDESLARITAFAGRINKLPVPVSSNPGFLVNRVLMPYLMEALHMIHEGIPAKAIDQQGRSCGMPMGPVELADQVGLDICLHVAEVLAEKNGSHEQQAVLDLLRRMIAAGELGRKSGQGFYVWQGQKALGGDAGALPVPEDLRERLLGRLLNEAVACLHEGVVDDPDALDAAMIYATGCAPFRGGPMGILREDGIDTWQQILEDLRTHHGDRFKASPGWRHLAQSQALSDNNGRA